jgi:hypothetical protein
MFRIVRDFISMIEVVRIFDWVIWTFIVGVIRIIWITIPCSIITKIIISRNAVKGTVRVMLECWRPSLDFLHFNLQRG